MAIVPEGVTEPLAFAIVAELPGGAVPCGPLLPLVDPTFPLLGGGAADADPSTLIESLQGHTELGRGVPLTGKNQD